MIALRPPAVLLVMRRSRRGDEGDASDEALLSGMAVGDERAGLIFVRRYQHRVFGMAVSIVGDTALAEDVAQEALIRIFRHASVFDARRGSVSTWTLTITRNLAIDALRAQRSSPTDPGAQVFLQLISPDRLPEDAAVTEDAVGRVRTALENLPVDQCRAVLLAAMCGRTAAEIAHTEAIPIGTAKGRIRLGMAKLREALEIEGAQ